MGFWKSFKRAAKGAARDVSADLGKNKDYLEACCASAALVAAADGTVSDVEKRTTISIIAGNPTLGKLYPQNEIEQCARTMLDRVGSSSGRASLAKELGDVKNLPNAGDMADYVFLIAKDIAEADGDVGDKEKAVLQKIANLLGVDPAKFDF